MLLDTDEHKTCVFLYMKLTARSSPKKTHDNRLMQKRLKSMMTTQTIVAYSNDSSEHKIIY